MDRAWTLMLVDGWTWLDFIMVVGTWLDIIELGLVVVNKVVEHQGWKDMKELITKSYKEVI